MNKDKNLIQNKRGQRRTELRFNTEIMETLQHGTKNMKMCNKTK
jgi:hypothetical protein